MEIITTTEELKHADSAVTHDLEIESIASYIEEAECNARQILGQDVINYILTKPDGAITLRRVVAGWALSAFSSSGAVMIDNTGFFVVRSEKKAPASDKKLMNYRVDAAERGWKALEQLVSHMEANASDYVVWQNSPLRVDYYNTLFGNSGEFSAFGGVAISATLFHKIKPLIRRVEESVLDVNFGEELIEDLRFQRLSHILSAPYKKLERKFMHVVAPLAISEAIPLQLVTVSDTGVFQASVAAIGNSSDNVQSFSAVEYNRLRLVLQRLNQEGSAALIQTLKWLRDNISDYPLASVAAEVDREKINNVMDSNIYLL